MFHSGEGQTAKVVERMVATIEREDDVRVHVADADDAPDPGSFDAVIAGDSIHAGRHSRPLTRYLVAHADALNERPLALFQVSLTSVTDDEQHDRDARDMLEQLIDAAGVDPELVGLFGGALAYTQYGWLKRRVMRVIAQREGGDTDTSRDYDYTDWDEVDGFATDAVNVFRASAAG